MDPTSPPEPPRRKGIIEAIKGYVVNALGATRSRVDDFSAEVEYRAFRILWLIVWALVGITSASIAVTFAMLTVIFGLHLPAKYAFGIPALLFAVVSLVALVMFQKTKRSRRTPERTDPRRG
jgi:Putative Actinobacterial Holin-X, holin superfamily III